MQQKMKLDSYCPNIIMETVFMNTENSKTNELHIYVLNLLQRLDLSNSNKHFVLQKVTQSLKTSKLYTWKNQETI